MSAFDLSGRKALVTGGAGSLGQAFGLALVAAGASVVLTDVLTEQGRANAAGLAGPGAGYFVEHDVTSDASWTSAVARATELLGGLDIAVNNAGIEITSLFVDLDEATVRKQLEVNVLGTALGIKHAFRTMRPEGAAGTGGVIINIASVAATIAFPGIPIYSATKSAVDRLTRVAAAESGRLGYGVRVNCIYPGLIPNPMGLGLAVTTAEAGLFPSADEAAAAVVGLTPSGRLASTDDIANAVLYLASDAASFVNGAGLPVDGGLGM